MAAGKLPSKVLLWDMELHSPGKEGSPNFLPPREEEPHLGLFPPRVEPSMMVCPLQTDPAVLSKVQAAVGR